MTLISPEYDNPMKTKGLKITNKFSQRQKHTVDFTREKYQNEISKSTLNRRIITLIFHSLYIICYITFHSRKIKIIKFRETYGKQTRMTNLLLLTFDISLFPYTYTRSLIKIIIYVLNISPPLPPFFLSSIEILDQKFPNANNHRY